MKSTKSQLRLALTSFCVLAAATSAFSATVAEFKFDSVSSDGKTASDVSGNSHDATFVNPITLSDDTPYLYSGNKSALLSSNSAAMANPGTMNFNFDTAITGVTLEAWVKPSVGAKGTIVSVIANPNSDGSVQGFALGLTDGLKPSLLYYHNWGGTYENNPGISIPANQWTHIAAQYKPSTWGTYLYINGVPYYSGALGWGCTLTEASIGTDSDLYYGSLTGDVLVDDVKVSNVPLDPTQLGYSNAPTQKPISFQGKLTNPAGAAVADGDYAVAFTAYDAETGGNVLWKNNTVVHTTKGVFSTSLMFPTSVYSAQAWLGVKVGTDNEMAPRIKMNAAPSAYVVAQ